VSLIIKDTLILRVSEKNILKSVII